MRSERNIGFKSTERSNRRRADMLAGKQWRWVVFNIFYLIGLGCAGAGLGFAQTEEPAEAPLWEEAPDVDAVIGSLRWSTRKTEEDADEASPAWWKLSIESEDPVKSDSAAESYTTAQSTGSIDRPISNTADTERDVGDSLEVPSPTEAPETLKAPVSAVEDDAKSLSLAPEDNVVEEPSDDSTSVETLVDDSDVVVDDQAAVAADGFGGQNSAGSPFALFSLVTTLGSVSLAIAMALLAARMSRSLRTTAGQWRSQFAILESKLNRAETIFNAQPDLVIVWDEDTEVPAEGWGHPKVLGNPMIFATLLTYAEGAAGSTPVENILSGLATQAVEPRDSVLSFLQDDESIQSASPNLIEAIQNLRWNGNGFSLVVKGFDGREIEVEGRPAGAQAVIWLTDITSKTRSIGDLREKLRQLSDESNQLRTFLDAAPFPVWRRSAKKKLSWVNNAYAEAVDLESPLEAVAMAVELDSGTKALADRVKESGATQKEKHYIVVNGQRRAFEIIEMPHDNGFVGMALDVTGKDAAEKELQRHIDAQAQTLNKLATAVSIFGPDKKIQFYNQAYARLWKFDPAWLDTHPAHGEILDRLRENRLLPEQADFKAWKEKILAHYTKVSDQPDEIWHLPDSRHLRVACQSHPMGGLLFLYEDVTDRFRLESSLNTLTKVQRATLDNLSEGVAVFGSDGKLELHNKSFCDIWRLESDKLEEQPHFTAVVEWCRPLFDNDQEWRRMAERVTSFSEQRHRLPGRLERRDGSQIDYAILPLPNGATLLTFLDVTDTTRITQALRDRNEALEAADRLKSEFISHVSYQLRTPLTTVKGFSEMLQGEMVGDLNERQHEYSNAILEASNQLLVLMDDILDLARIEAGVMSLELSDVDLFSTLSNSRELALGRADDANITIKLEVDQKIGSIKADERRLSQIIFNLLSNAISFTGASSVVTLGAERSNSDVCIWVSDTGMGIAPEDLPAVFDRFESRGTAGRRRGPGLGLALVRSFVELHSGWVALESTPQVGTKVSFHLPAAAKHVRAKRRRKKKAAAE